MTSVPRELGEHSRVFVPISELVEQKACHCLFVQVPSRLELVPDGRVGRSLEETQAEMFQETIELSRLN